MRYGKPALSFDQQAQRLIDRGLVVSEKAALIERLRAVNYYRLSAYWYPFKRIDLATGAESFAPSTTFETIWQRYTFDRQLRLLVMDALEHVEVAVLRTRMVEQFTRLHRPFGYTDPRNFKPGFASGGHQRLLNELNEAVSRSNEEFGGRFRLKYAEEPHLPLWMAAEVMTFGQLFTLYRNLHRSEQQSLAGQFGLFPPVFESWLHSLNFIRNACAHHARPWNRQLPIRPLLPDARHRPEWHSPVKISNDRVFAVLTLLRVLLRSIDPANWREYPIWR